MMKNMKKMILLFALALALALPAMAENVQAAGPVDEEAEAELSGYVILMHTGDTLGRPDEGLGLGRVAEARTRFEAEGAAVLLLDAGNAFPLPGEGEPDAGEEIAVAMAAAGYDAMTPGAADFAGGADRLGALARAAGFPLLSVNALDAAGARLLTGSVILEKNGLRLGVFGLTGAEAAGGTAVSDVTEAAQAAVTALQGEGCDVIVALATLGLDESGAPVAAAVAQAVPGVSIVIDGTAGAPETGLWLENGALVASGVAGLEKIGLVAIDPSGRCAALAMDESWF